MKRGETCRGAGDHESWWSCRIRRGPAVQCEICGLYVRIDSIVGAWRHDAMHASCEVMASTLYAAEPGASFAWHDVAGIARDDGWTFEPATKTWAPPAA